MRGLFLLCIQSFMFFFFHVVAGGGEGGKRRYRTENVIIKAIRAHSYRFQYKNTPFLLKIFFRVMDRWCAVIA